MRAILTILLSGFAIAAFAQVDVSFFGVHSTIPAYSINQGWGGGMNMLSPSVPIAIGKNAFPIQTQFGGGYVLGSAGNATLRDVRFNARPNENAKVNYTNMHYGFYGMTRFSSDKDNRKYAPYIDLMAGVRGATANVSVYYKDSDEPYYEETVSSAFHFGYGGGAGMLIRIGNSAMVDAGIMWQSMPRAKFIDMNSVNASDGLSFSTVNTPPGILMFKIGLLISAGTRNCCGVSKCGVAGHHEGKCKARHE